MGLNEVGYLPISCTYVIGYKYQDRINILIIKIF